MVEGPYPSGPKILYIGGTGRTGSTLLTRLLGEVPGWFPGGELAFLWRYGLTEGGNCSCGLPVRDCPLWSEVLAATVEAGFAIDAERMVALRRKCWSLHLPLMLHPTAARRLMDRLDEFPATVEALYRSIAAVTRSRVIIDSSKEPHYSWILRDRTDLDVHFLQLVRDPRAIAHSWSRERDERGFGGGAVMEQRRPLRAGVYHNVSNVAAEAIWAGRADRFRFLRYEDFIVDPINAVRAIGEFLGEPIEQSPIDGKQFEATAQHIAWGNPGRFDAGAIELREDDAWRSGLGRVDGLIMTAATAPVARRYGYPLRRSAARRDVPVARLRSRQIPEDSP